MSGPVTTFKFNQANELASDILTKLGPRIGEPGTLIEKFQQMKKEQFEHHRAAEDCTNLWIQCPKEGKLVCVINKNVRQLISYDLPVAFERLMNARVDLSDSDHDGVNLYGFQDTEGLLVHLKYSHLDQTGDITIHNRSQFSGDKNVVLTKGKVTRTLQAVGYPDLVNAHHWPAQDKAAAEFICMWMEVSMQLLELHHMLVYSLHLEHFLLSPSDSKQFEKGSCNAVLRDHVFQLYKKAKKGSKVNPDDDEFLKKVAKYVDSEFENILGALVTQDAKTRLISTPFSRNAYDDPQLKLTSAVHFNKIDKACCKGADDMNARLKDAWMGPWQEQVLRYHKKSQYTKLPDGSPYPYKGAPFTGTLYDAINKPEINPQFHEAIHHPEFGMIAQGVLPENNYKIKMQDSSGRELKSPKDGQPLTGFEAACAYSVLGNSGAIVLLSKIGMLERCKTAKRNPVVYGIVNAFQPVITSQYTSKVMREVYEFPENKRGQQTDPPAFNNPFDNMKSLIHDYKHIWSGSTGDNATTLAAQVRHDAFADYGSDQDEGSPSKKQRINEDVDV